MRTLHLQFEHNGIFIRWARTRVSFRGLCVPVQPAQTFGVTGERNETQAVGEYFILDDGGVVVYEDGFDGEGGYLGEEDATEGVGD